MSAADVSNVADHLSQAMVGDGSAELSFAGRGIKMDNESDAKEIVDAILESKNLKNLRLEGNTLGIDAAKAISKALEKHPEFERAKWSDMFTGRLKSEIPQALRYLGSGIILAKAKLVELDLSDNAFGPNGMEGLTDFLQSESCYGLKELRLNNNGLGVTGGKMLAKCLLECHKSSSAAGTPLGLRVFVSGRGRLEDVGSMALAEAFKAMGSLEELSMPQNGITHVGIKALANAMASNPNLRSLNLNDNTFTEVGAKAMAKALPHMQKLEVLNFGDCLLRTGGAEAIAGAIKQGHQQLKEITLSFNEIRAPGASAVADAMENKVNLVKLDLDGNQLGDDGIDEVRAVMEGYDKIDLLGSLSEDEGDSEDEEDDENGADEDNEDEPEDDQDGEELNDKSLEVTGVAITPRPDQRPVSAADFLAFPSPTKLLSISGNKAEEIVNCLGDDVQDVDKAIGSFTRISAVVTEEDTKAKEIACECTDAILSKLLGNGDENIVPLVSNALLAHLGLIKSEGKLKPPTDIKGSLIVLEHTVQQTYFPKPARDILLVFLSRPHALLEKSGQVYHRLLQTLHKF